MNFYNLRLAVFALVTALALGAAKPTPAATILFDFVGRSPAFGVSGADWYFDLSLAASDSIHAGDQLRIAFLPWLGYSDHGPYAKIVDQYQSESGVLLPPCTTCASHLAFADNGTLPNPIFTTTAFTPLTVAQFDALKITCPACVENHGLSELGFFQATFTYTATSDVAGVLDHLAFFDAGFLPTTNPPPAAVWCPTARLTDARGNLLLNGSGLAQLDTSCDSLLNPPLTLADYQSAILAIDPDAAPRPGNGLPKCQTKIDTGNCALLAVVPEPAPTALLVAGFLALLFTSRISREAAIKFNRPRTP